MAVLRRSVARGLSACVDSDAPRSAIAMCLAGCWFLWAAASLGASTSAVSTSTTTTPDGRPAIDAASPSELLIPVAPGGPVSPGGRDDPQCPPDYVRGLLGECSSIRPNPVPNAPVEALATVTDDDVFVTVDVAMREADNRPTISEIDWGDGSGWVAPRAENMTPPLTQGWIERWNAHVATCALSEVVDPPFAATRPAAIGSPRLARVSHTYSAPGRYEVRVVVSSGCDGRGENSGSTFWASSQELTMAVRARR